MKRRELAKKGLALVLTAVMCAQPLMVSAEEFSFQSEMEDAVVMEAEPEQVEESGEAEGFEDADGFLADDSLDEAEEVEADGETDEFVASLDESAAGLDIDESAATVIEGNVENAEGLTWRLDVNGVFYLDGEGELPDTFYSYKSNGNWVNFKDYSITSLVIGSKVSGSLYAIYLRDYVCTNLQNLFIKDRDSGVELKLAENAFSNWMPNLQKLIIGKGISAIGGAAFYGCKSLKEVTISDSVVEIGNSAFYECTSLEKIVIPSSVVTIGAGAFYGCTSLKEITIPNSVKTILGGAFSDISPEANLFIPDSVTTIENSYNLPDCKVTMPCRFALENRLYRREGYSFYHMNGANDQDEDNCTACRRTGSCGTDSTYIMTLSGKVTVSGTGTVSTFDNTYEDITSIIIEDGIYYVNTFDTCKKLESVKIGDSVKKVNAFWNCENLKTITIGKGLENDFTFENCPKMESVIISSDNPNYTSKDGVIYSKDGTRLVYYPANLRGDEYVIPTGVTKISRDAFYYNQNLKKIIVPETVQAISNYDDGEVYFKNCKSLETIVLNNTVNNIPYYFCSNSESLSEIVIPEGAEYIDSGAFRYCKNLKTITIPASVKRINNSAFDGCSSLNTVHYLGNADQWKAIELGEKNEFLTDAGIHYCTLIKDNAGTCDNAGTRDYSCATCGTTFTVNVPKTEHNYSEWEVTRKATCSQEGEETSICSKCGDTKHQAIEKAYHDFEWTGGVDATCEKDGMTQSKKCINCGYVEVAGEVIPAYGHNYYVASHTWTSCTEKIKEVDRCSNCGKEVAREMPATGHQYNSSTYYPATVLAPETIVKRCSICGNEEKTETGSKLPATISVNTTSITLKVKQATTKVQVSNLAVGDAIKSWTSSNTKIVKVTDSGKIIAQNKTGTANVTVTLLSGKTATIKVKVQKGVVKTTKISGLKNTTLKVKKKLTLVPVIYPITSVQKVTYKSSNKKVATVSSKGVVTAKKKGKTVITVKSGSKKVSIKITVK